MHLLFLSGENLELARIEAESLLELENTKLSGQYLYATIPSKNVSKIHRLAFTKQVYEALYTTGFENLEASLKSYPLINYYKEDFCLRIEKDEESDKIIKSNSKQKLDEKYYSKFIWNNLEKHISPKVNLSNPTTLIHIIFRTSKNKTNAIVTIRISDNYENFESRKAHNRPLNHPTAMHPKMARALVNILNTKPSEKIIDPFCGACGILTEAGLMNLKFTGSDIDNGMIERAKINLKHYNINPKLYSITKKDALKIKNLKNIVTDLPYGKSSKKSEEIITLYKKFIKNIAGKAVIVMPNFVNVKKIVSENLSKKLNYKIIDHYVHKSLTRKIIVINGTLYN